MLHFIDDLTNWYIRRSRRRFWKDAETTAEKNDKLAAYATLYEVLTTISRVLAPLMPFVSERLYQNLVVAPGIHELGEESIHLCNYPEADLQKIDEKLESSVEVVRRVVAMARALREKHRIKTRQPLLKITVVTHDENSTKALSEHAELITSELNVKELSVVAEDDQLCIISCKPNFKSLGPRVGKDMAEIGKAINALNRQQLATLESGQSITLLGYDIGIADVVITRQALKDVVLMSDEHLTVALDTELSEELIHEGLMRDSLSLLQRLRKSSGLSITDRINLELFADQELAKALRNYEPYIKSELLASNIIINVLAELPGNATELVIEGHKLFAVLQRCD
jgi:isoleucyl-tRNA synthetase